MEPLIGPRLKNCMVVNNKINFTVNENEGLAPKVGPFCSIFFCKCSIYSMIGRKNKVIV